MRLMVGRARKAERKIKMDSDREELYASGKTFVEGIVDEEFSLKRVIGKDGEVTYQLDCGNQFFSFKDLHSAAKKYSECIFNALV